MADQENKSSVVTKFLGLYWQGIFMLVWPPICGLLFLLGIRVEVRCLFVVAVMAGYWITECIPLFVTGLLPVVLFPMLNILTTQKVCICYFHPTNMMFLAAMLIAISIEHCGLHNRVALCAILIVGASPRNLHFGLLMITMLLSMFLINAATTAMMCPIIAAVLGELESQGIGKMYEDKDPKAPAEEKPRPTKITTAYYLGVAYASTIGGIGSLVGTGTNLVFKGLYESRFPQVKKVEFVDWLLYNFPGMLIMGILMYLSIQIQCMGLFRPNSAEYATVQEGIKNKDIAYNVLKKKQQELGPCSWHEIGVGMLFLTIIGLWFFRSPYFMPGWGNLYPDKHIKDATPAIFVVIMLIAVPSSLEFFQYCTMKAEDRPKVAAPGLVTWKVYQTKMSWGLLFLLGGGFAISSASSESGMSEYVGNALSGMKNIHWLIVMALTSFISSAATELTSNMAICNIIVPVLLEMSVVMNCHPILFTFPSCLNCSFAFMMPVGTPANAIAAEYANIKNLDMAKVGFFVKLITWGVTCCVWPTFGQVIYPLMEHPDLSANATAPP